MKNTQDRQDGESQIAVGICEEGLILQKQRWVLSMKHLTCWWGKCIAKSFYSQCRITVVQQGALQKTITVIGLCKRQCSCKIMWIKRQRGQRKRYLYIHKCPMSKSLTALLKNVFPWIKQIGFSILYIQDSHVQTSMVLRTQFLFLFWGRVRKSGWKSRTRKAL